MQWYAAQWQIGPREQEILTAIVETYISTGEPVGSRTLARINREGLSPATIRNVMADLADAGLLEQPHTSAGRMPTADAYRYYVDQISGQAQLSPDDKGVIETTLHGVSDVQEFMERTSHVLSLISHGVGVTMASGGPKNALEHIYFSRLGDKKILAVVVTEVGRGARPRAAHGRRPAAGRPGNGRALHQRQFPRLDAGRRSSRTGETHRARAQRVRPADAVPRATLSPGRAGAEEAAPGIFWKAPPTWSPARRTRSACGNCCRRWRKSSASCELLTAYLDAKQEAVRVVIGLEEAAPDLRNFVLIGAPARVGGEVMGSLAVIGPTRIDYQHTITAVSYIARLFDKILNESE